MYILECIKKMSMTTTVKNAFMVLGIGAVAVVSLAAVVLTGLAVIGGFKDTGLVDNTSAAKFEAGLVIFGTFIGVIVIALVGIVIIMMFRKTDN
jgi:hypothetical protein